MWSRVILTIIKTEKWRAKYILHLYANKIKYIIKLNLKKKDGVCLDEIKVLHSDLQSTEVEQWWDIYLKNK